MDRTEYEQTVAPILAAHPEVTHHAFRGNRSVAIWFRMDAMTPAREAYGNDHSQAFREQGRLERQKAYEIKRALKANPALAGLKITAMNELHQESLGLLKTAAPAPIEFRLDRTRKTLGEWVDDTRAALSGLSAQAHRRSR